MANFDIGMHISIRNVDGCKSEIAFDTLNCHCFGERVIAGWQARNLERTVGGDDGGASVAEVVSDVVRARALDFYRTFRCWRSSGQNFSTNSEGSFGRDGEPRVASFGERTNVDGLQIGRA